MYLPSKKDAVLHSNKLEFTSPKDALYHLVEIGQSVSSEKIF